MQINIRMTLSAVALLFSSGAYSASSYLNSTWPGIFPNSKSDDNAGCQLCHASSTSYLNPYGAAICASNAGNIGARIQDVSGLNSDADPTVADNLAEINADTQPGWTPGNVNLIYSRGNCSPTGTVSSPPSGIYGDLDPPIGNVQPIAVIAAPGTGTVGIAVSFDGSGSSDPDGTIVSYNWDFGDNASGSGVTTTHTYLTDGVFTVSLTVTDDYGDSVSTTRDITIALGNQAPISDPSGPYTGTVNLPVSFDGSASNDPDGSIISYSWEFGDGNVGSSLNPSHTYTVAGVYNVTLTVMDDAGVTDASGTTANITVPVNQPPVADANGPYTGTSGIAVTFDGSGSSDPDGEIVTYSWDFGDGSSGTGLSPTHTYSGAGNYSVVLTVTDDSGDTDLDATTASVDVVNQPPSADANGPYTGTVGTPVNFDGSGSSDTDGNIVSYNWDFGDGNLGTGATPAHSYSVAGVYSVSLTVTDNSGDSATATSTATIAVGNQPPVSDPNGPYTGTVYIAVTFDGSGSSDPDGTINAYSWSFGDGRTGTGVSPSHVYTTAGVYNVTLTVTDNSGVSDATGSTVTISGAGGNNGDDDDKGDGDSHHDDGDSHHGDGDNHHDDGDSHHDDSDNHGNHDSGDEHDSDRNGDSDSDRRHEHSH
ncbi:PKD domain-containing protein [Gynuella sp.]|uniref:PKD domain-containing protein n=1 Tax=Gynuella sp. TaxID=2969146 RepID=UPI003D1386E5